jgi:O-antigen ligase
MRDAKRQLIELQACGPADPDAQRAASVLAAYFKAEQKRAFRQILWPRLALGAIVAWVVEAITPLLTEAALVAALLAFVAAAAAVAVSEWRAGNALRALIQSQRGDLLVEHVADFPSQRF